MNKLETVRTSIDVSINIPINNINFNLDKFINLEQDTISPDKLIIKANIETQKLTSLIGSLTLGTDNELNNALAQIQNIKVDSVIDGKEVYLKLPAYLGENWVYFPESTTENLMKSSNYSLELKNLSEYTKEIKRLKNEKIGKNWYYRFHLILDAEKFFKLYPDNLGISSASELKNTEIDIDLRARKKDFLIEDMDWEIIFNSPQDNKLKMTLGVEFTKFNEDIEFKKPEGAKEIWQLDQQEISNSPIGKLINIAMGNLGGYIGVDQADYQQKQRDSQRKSDLLTIKTALEMYYEENSRYPAIKDDTKDGKFLENLLIPKYLATTPKDPLHPQFYYLYKPINGGKGYELTCVLENKSDPLGIKIGNLLIYKITNQ